MTLSPAAPTRMGTSARSSLSLTLATPNGTVLKHFNSRQGTIDLGRGHKNSEECRDPSQGRFRLEGSAVMSSKQAVLTWEDHSYAFITDTDSTNGTFITRDGEEQLKLKAGVSYRLENDDLITFGQPVQSSRAERKCEPTPLCVAIFNTPIATTASVEPRLDERNVSAMSSPNGYALSRSRTLKPGRRQSSVSSSANEQEQEDRDAELWHSTLRTPSRGFGLSEDDLLQSTEEGELEVVETIILKTVKSSGSFDEERQAAWADSDDEIEVVESTQHAAEMIVLGDSASDQGDSASDMQLDDDEEEEEEEERSDHDEEMQPSAIAELSEVEDEDDNAIELESDHDMSDIAVEEDEGSEEDIAVQQHVSRSPSPQLGSARDDSPIVEDVSVVTVVTIEEIKSSTLKTQQAVESTTSVKVPSSPAPQRLPSPISPEQVSSRPLDDSPPPIKEPSPELEAPPRPSFSFAPFPPSQIKPKRGLFSGGFFQKLNIPKAASTTTSTRAEQGSRCTSPFDGTAASALSFAAVDDEVGSQASHLPSPTSSIDLDYEDAVDDVEQERNPWASAGDWGTSIFKAAEEDSAAASDMGAESRDKSVSPLYEEDLTLEYSQSVSDDEEQEEQDDFGATDELDLDMVPEELANTEWFDKEALDELDDILATLETECPNCATSAHQLDDVFDTPPVTRKRTFSSTDMATSTDVVNTTDASVNTVALVRSPPVDAPPSLPIAPLPKRRRIARDLGHVTLGFGLGVVVAVAGLSALSGTIQAMDV